MVEQPVVRFHIGATRVATNIIECAFGNLTTLPIPPSTHIISNREYKKFLRSAVNEKRELDFQQGLVDPELKSFFDKLSGKSSVGVSQHAMLGHPKDVFKHGEILPTAKRRVRRLLQIFEGSSIELHLAIASQHDYILALSDEVDRSQLMMESTSSIPSWFNLVRRIQSASPKTKLVVWDFERPNWVALPFLSMILNIDPNMIDEELRTDLRENSCQGLKLAQTISKIFEFSDDFSARMDEQYEQDLEKITELEGVTLVRGEQVPNHLRLEFNA